MAVGKIKSYPNPQRAGRAADSFPIAQPTSPEASPRPNFVDPLPGVPKVELPFFAYHFDETDPHYRIACDLRDKGFAVFDFPDPEFDALSGRIREGLCDRMDWDEWRTNGGDRRMGNAWSTNEDVRRVAANQKVLDLLTHLYGRRAFPFQTLNFPVGTQQHFHTDSVHFSSMPERFMCGVWVAFEDIGADQGPLVYYPGSHKWPIYTHQHIGYRFNQGDAVSQDRFHEMWEQLVEVHGIKPERFLPRKGQALIWSANLLHGGDMQIDRNKSRWSQVTHYYFEDCLYYTPLGSNEPIGDLLIRSPDDIAAGGQEPSRYHGSPVDTLPTMLDLPGRRGRPPFDPDQYLALNPDVRDAGWDPFRHYVFHGIIEGRRWF